MFTLHKHFFTWTLKEQKVKPWPALLFLTGIFLKRYFHSKTTICFNTSTANSLQKIGKIENIQFSCPKATA